MNTDVFASVTVVGGAPFTDAGQVNAVDVPAAGAMILIAKLRGFVGPVIEIMSACRLKCNRSSPGVGFPQSLRPSMHPQARQTLRELRSLTNIEKYLKSANAELASDLRDERLRAFIAVIEGLLRGNLFKES